MESLKKMSSARLFNIFKRNRTSLRSAIREMEYDTLCGRFSRPWFEIPSLIKLHKENRLIVEELIARNWKKPTKQDKKNARRSKVSNKEWRGLNPPEQVLRNKRCKAHGR